MTWNVLGKKKEFSYPIFFLSKPEKADLFGHIFIWSHLFLKVDSSLNAQEAIYFLM